MYSIIMIFKVIIMQNQSYNYDLKIVNNAFIDIMRIKMNKFLLQQIFLAFRLILVIFIFLHLLLKCVVIH